MTLQQKVGQLFVIEVAGRHATAVSDAAKAVNQRLYGVDTPAQANAKYQPGGVIYYTTRVACTGCATDDNIGDPAQVATLSNGLQAASLTAVACRPATSMTNSWPTFCCSVMCFISESTRPRYGASPALPGSPAVAAGGPKAAAITSERPMTAGRTGFRVRRVVGAADRENTGASELICPPR
jgi:hypothetical protein